MYSATTRTHKYHRPAAEGRLSLKIVSGRVLATDSSGCLSSPFLGAFSIICKAIVIYVACHFQIEVQGTLSSAGPSVVGGGENASRTRRWSRSCPQWALPPAR